MPRDACKELELVAGFPPRGGINFDSGQAQKKDALPDVLFGACGRIRTGDLLITSELLCQLSHTSISMRIGSSPYSVC